MVRAQRICPASCKRFTSVSPETSSSLVRVSDTVSTAMCAGTKAMLVSILSLSETGGIFGGPGGSLTWRRRLRHRRRRDRRVLGRRLAPRRLVPALGVLAKAAAIHPLILHQ